MCYIVIMTRTHFSLMLCMRKQYLCPIPLNAIKEIAYIEKKEWRKFCFPPYNGLGKFIATHLDTYPTLRPYVSLKTKAFDFSYQYVCDYSTHINTTYTLNNRGISESEYDLYNDDYYIEKWKIFNTHTHQALTFFEFKNTPTHVVLNNYR